MNFFVRSIICIFFFLITFLPRSHTLIKVPFLVILMFIGCIFLINEKNMYINKKYINWFFSFIFFGATWVFIGALKGNAIEGLLDYFRLYVIWGGVYFLLALALSNSSNFPIIFKVLFVSNFVISVYNILIYTNAINVTSLNFLYHLDSQSRVGIHSGYVQITSHNIGTLIFTTPFIITYYVLSNKKNTLVLLNIVISLIAILISGRRIFLLNFVICSVFILIIILFFYRDKLKKYLYFQVVTIILFILSMPVLSKSIDISVLTERFFSEFTVQSATDEDGIRLIQIRELLKASQENPILGTGLAKGISTVVRDRNAPWSYEAIFPLLFYNTGIVGFSVYLYTIIINFKCSLKTIRLKREQYMPALLVGYTSFLVANFSNPYSQSFDFIWILFVIVAYYNFLQKEELINE